MISRCAQKLCVVILTLCVGCASDSDKDAIDGYKFDGSASAALTGRWELWSKPRTPLHTLLGKLEWFRPPFMELRAGDQCAESPELTEFLDRCDDQLRRKYGWTPQTSALLMKGSCGWGVEPQGGEILITGQRADRTWRRLRLSSYRHSQTKAVALIGSCGSDFFRLQSAESR